MSIIKITEPDYYTRTRLLQKNPIFLYGDYEFYTSLVDVAEGFYLIDEIELAQNLSIKIADQYSKRMELFAQFSPSNQLQLQDRIKQEWTSYNYFLQIINSYDDTSFFNSWEEQYNENVLRFNSELDSVPSNE